MSAVNIGVEVDAIRAVFPRARIEHVSDFVMHSLRVSVRGADHRDYCAQYPIGRWCGIKCVEALARMLAESAYGRTGR